MSKCEMVKTLKLYYLHYTREREREMKRDRERWREIERDGEREAMSICETVS